MWLRAVCFDHLHTALSLSLSVSLSHCLLESQLLWRAAGGPSDGAREKIRSTDSAEAKSPLQSLATPKIGLRVGVLGVIWGVDDEGDDTAAVVESDGLRE